MGIWERVGSVIKSYLNNDEETVFAKSPKGHARQGDPDLDAAYDELDDFLNGKENRDRGREGQRETGGEKQRARSAPDHLRKDFEELGISPEATPEECKEAYKNLLKKYHPDRHAQTSENLKTATEKTARINAAYDRLLEWFKA